MRLVPCWKMVFGASGTCGLRLQTKLSLSEERAVFLCWLLMKAGRERLLFSKLPASTWVVSVFSPRGVP